MRRSPAFRYPGPEQGLGRRISCSLSGWLQQGWLTVAMCPLSVGEACRRHAGANGTHPWVACSPRYAVDLDTGGPFAARRLGSEAVETSQQVTPGLCITNALRGHASPVRGLEIPSAGRTWCSPLPAAPGSPAVRVAAGRCRARRHVCVYSFHSLLSPRRARPALGCPRVARRRRPRAAGNHTPPLPHFHLRN